MIICNHATGRSAIAKGARAYVVNPNIGNAGERVEIAVRSRGGRWINKWEDIGRLENFRFKKRAPENVLEKNLAERNGNLDLPESALPAILDAKKRREKAKG